MEVSGLSSAIHNRKIYLTIFVVTTTSMRPQKHVLSIALVGSIMITGACKLVASGSGRALDGQVEPAEEQGNQAQDRIVGEVDPGQMTVLKGSLHPLAQYQYDAGRANGDKRIEGMTIYFSLSSAQHSELDQLLQAQQDSSSQQYHKWLIPAQYGNLFGLTNDDLAKVETWLQSQGFSIDSVSPTQSSLRFSGTVTQVEKAFQTKIHSYTIDGEPHIANATALSIPTALSGVILGVRNLTDFRPLPKHVSRNANSEVTAHFTSSISGNHYLAPDDFATIYDVKPLYNAGYVGSGKTIVVVGQSAIETSDVANFRSAAGLPSNTPTFTLVPGSGTSTVTDTNGDEDESDLDVEWSGAVAKAATINFVYVGNNRNYSVYDALQYAIDNNLAPVISISYGACEADYSQTDIATLESLLQQANAQGQTVVAAAGDSGAADCDYSTNSTPAASATHGLAVDFPASSPYVTGIGGTEFYGDVSTPGTYWSSTNNSNNGSAISYIPEEVWNDTSATNGIEAGGGGKSVLFSKPSWQTGTGVPTDSGRDVPDIALNASPQHDGYLFCASGSDSSSCSNGFRDSQSYLTVGGGTSFGAPTFAGILTLINQKLGPGGQGNINPTLYQAAASDYSSAFHDITTGNNEVPCTAGSTDCGSSGYIGYSATTGYDLASGWGSVDAFNLAGAFSSVAAKTNTATALSYSPNTIVVGETITLTAKVSPSSGSSTPTGTVTFTVDGSDVGSPVALSSGTASTTISFSAAGSHTISATYSGDSNFNSSNASTTVSVSASAGGASTTTTVSANPPSVALGSSVVLTANVTSNISGTVTGTVEFTLGNTTLGTVTLGSGSGSLTVVASSSNGFSVGSNTITATFSGDSNYASSSGTTTVTVTQPAITVSATNVTVAALGDSGTSTVTVTSTGGYAGTVKFSASTTSSLNGTYTFSPSTVTLTSGGSGTTALTIHTSSNSMRTAPGSELRGNLASVGFATFALVWLFPIGRRRRTQTFLCLVFLGILIAGAGCGSGNSNPGAGNYTITVTATDSSNSSITTSTAFTFTIK
ncbi:MAG: Ig-like domain repeat protein [Acidobacteriaceae bacterium]